MYIKHVLYQKKKKKILSLPIDWSQLNHSTILIAGATGMIGTMLVDTLMESNKKNNSNIKVLTIGRSLEHAQKRFSTYFNHPLFKFIPQDINQEISIDEEITYIFHCASNTHPKAYASDPIGTIMTNIVGTNNLLKFAALNNVKRTVFLSSVEIYGENTGSISQFSETDLGYIDCNTVRAGYPEGKRAGESLCQAYISKWDMDIVISRICRVYGPTMLYNDSKALSQFIKNAVNKEDIVLKSDGLQHYSYCYVADTVSALLYILLYGVKGNAYNIADEKSDVLLKDLTLMLSSYVGTKVSYKLPDEIEKAGFSKATKALLNAQKLKQLGWNACYNLEDGLQRTLSILMDM